MEAKLLLDVSEAAELCGVSRPTMYQILAQLQFLLMESKMGTAQQAPICLQ